MKLIDLLHQLIETEKLSKDLVDKVILVEDTEDPQAPLLSRSIVLEEDSNTPIRVEGMLEYTPVYIVWEFAGIHGIRDMGIEELEAELRAYQIAND